MDCKLLLFSTGDLSYAFIRCCLYLYSCLQFICHLDYGFIHLAFESQTRIKGQELYTQQVVTSKSRLAQNMIQRLPYSQSLSSLSSSSFLILLVLSLGSAFLSPLSTPAPATLELALTTSKLDSDSLGLVLLVLTPE